MGFGGVVNYKFIDAMHQRMFQPFVDGLFAPGQGLLFGYTFILDRGGHLQQPFRRILPAIEDHVFNGKT